MAPKSNPKWKEKVGLTYEEHVREKYSPSITLARELERTMGKNEAYKLIKETYEKDAAQWAAEAGKKMGIESFKDFLDYIKRTYSSPYWNHVLTYTIKDAPNEYRFTCSECLNAKVLRDMGAADLGYLMLCNTDFASTSAFHPKLRLERTKTLMEGDDCCNFHCIWKDDK